MGERSGGHTGLGGEITERRRSFEVDPSRMLRRQVAVEPVGQGTGLDRPDAHDPDAVPLGHLDQRSWPTGHIGPSHVAGGVQEIGHHLRHLRRRVRGEHSLEEVRVLHCGDPPGPDPAIVHEVLQGGAGCLLEQGQRRRPLGPFRIRYGLDLAVQDQQVDALHPKPGKAPFERRDQPLLHADRVVADVTFGHQSNPIGKSPLECSSHHHFGFPVPVTWGHVDER